MVLFGVLLVMVAWFLSEIAFDQEPYANDRQPENEVGQYCNHHEVGGNATQANTDSFEDHLFFRHLKWSEVRTISGAWGSYISKV